MRRSIWNREQAYRRRLYMLAPVAAVLMILLFLTSDRIPFREIEKQVGWKGELRLLPEITIVPDEDNVTSLERQRRSDAMTSLDLDLIDDGDLPATGQEDIQKQKDEPLDLTEFEDLDVRTIRKSHDVPYSEDYVILKMVEPTYPPEELELGIEGTVTVELLVNEDGRVAKATVLASTGPESFQRASLDAARQFIFQPPVTDGKPTSMWIRFLIKFRIFS